MNPDLTHLQDADTQHALEIAPRTWWVGHVLPDDVFQCHVYLIEQGEQSILFDPGSRLTFAGTLRKIEEVIPFTKIRYFVCHHQDPDITAALPLINEMIERNDAVLITHWRTQALLKHYGLKFPFWLVEQHDWRLLLEDRELKFIFTPYAHFPGAICTFDPSTRVLFSSDLFGGFTERPTLVAQDEAHFAALRPFHEHYMPSRDILDFALNQIAQYPAQIIAPQHGSLIPERLVNFFSDKLRHLDCGLYLFAQGNTDLQRLTQLNETLREITQTLLLYRDFRDIAARLQEVVMRSLPVTRIDYYAQLEDGSLLTFAPETRFSGTIGPVPAMILNLFGRSREEWKATQLVQIKHNFIENKLHTQDFTSTSDEQGGQIITLPLFTPQRQRIEGAAQIHLNRPNPIAYDEAQIIAQIIMPLQVALEREVIYRTIELKRSEAYQRSIRDPLTGLFTRVYMQDVMERQCGIHDRDERLRVIAILLDIDHFKLINDTYGHLAGDEVLKQIAQVLRDSTRDTDIPVRYGGEEFILFMIGVSPSGASGFAERIRQAVASHPCEITSEGKILVTASFGIAAREPFEPLTSVIRRADEALYRAKQGGRNRCELAYPISGGANHLAPSVTT